jgi:tetratricopeptide (TPR) repeat protein
MAALIGGCDQSDMATGPAALSGSPAARAEYNAAFQALLAHPNDVETVLRYSQAAEKVGDYESSISPLEGLFLYDSNLPKVRLQLGILFLQLRSFHTAHNYFQTALVCPDIEPDARRIAEEAIARIPARYRSS